MAENEVIYLNRDNTSSLILVADGVKLADLSSITRVMITVDGITLDSNDGDNISWTEQVEYKGSQYDVISWGLGSTSKLPAGEYYGCWLITYDSDHPNGMVWTEDLTLVVK